MQRTRYPEETKTEALRLFAEHGAAEAARRTGVPAGTVASWANRKGLTLSDPEAMRPAVEARQMTLARRRAAFAERLHAVAAKLVDRIEEEDHPEALDVKRLMDAVGVAMNTAQMLVPITFGAPAAPAGDQPATPAEPMAQRERALAVVHQLGTRAS